MSKVTLTDLANLQNESTAVVRINSNNDLIETAFDNTLSLDGTSPNQMGADLDMNSNHILNLPEATDVTSPITLAQLNRATVVSYTNSAALAAAISDETGTGLLVFNTSPSLTTPVITNPAVSAGTFSGTKSITGATTFSAGNVTFTNSSSVVDFGNGTNYIRFQGTGSNDINAFGTALRLYSDTGGVVLRTKTRDPVLTITDGGTVTFNTACTMGLGVAANATGNGERVATTVGVTVSTGSVQSFFGDFTTSNLLIGTLSNHALAFRTNGTDRATISTAGAFDVVADVTARSGTSIPAGGTTGQGLKVSSTANFGVFFGSGAPTLSAAKGSLYLRSDGSGTTDRAYINTNGSTTWTALTTVA